MALLEFETEDPRPGDVASREGQVAREEGEVHVQLAAPAREGRRARPHRPRAVWGEGRGKDIYPRRPAHVAFESPLLQSAGRAHVNGRPAGPRFFLPRAAPCARSSRGSPGGERASPRRAVDLSQRGAGRQAVSSSVAHVYIGSSSVDSARLIATQTQHNARSQIAGSAR